MRHHSLLRLVERIYDAAAGAEAWDRVAPELAAAAGARAVTLTVQDPASGRFEVLTTPVPPDGIVAYQAHFHRVDLYTQRALAVAARSTTGTVPRVNLGGERLVPDSEFLRSEFWTDFCRLHGLRHIMGTIVPLGAAGMMPIGVHRPAGMPPFGATERAPLEAVLPHLQRALQVRFRLNGGAAARVDGSGLGALHALPSGVVVTDAGGAVILANPAAERLAAAANGFRLAATATGRLPTRAIATALHRHEAALLAALLQDAATGGPGGAMRLTDADGAASLAILVAPLPSHFSAMPDRRPSLAGGQAMLFLRALGSGAPPPRPELLRDLFALTRAEAEVACLLAGGATTARVAAIRAARETTVRTQVRALLAKTGVASLRELERLLASLGGL